MRTTIEIPDPLLDAVRRAAAADGTSVPSMIELALRNLIRDRITRADAARDRSAPAGPAPHGRMQEVFESYLLEGLGAPTDRH